MPTGLLQPVAQCRRQRGNFCSEHDRGPPRATAPQRTLGIVEAGPHQREQLTGRNAAIPHRTRVLADHSSAPSLWIDRSDAQQPGAPLVVRRRFPLHGAGVLCLRADRVYGSEDNSEGTGGAGALVEPSRLLLAHSTATKQCLSIPVNVTSIIGPLAAAISSRRLHAESLPCLN